VDELSLGDTVGAAVPTDVSRLLEFLLPKLPRERLAMHFHDTSGTALANVLAALELGILTFDSSAGGLGGCPFAPGATGNIATEDLVYMLERSGLATGIDLEKAIAVNHWFAGVMGKTLPSSVARAGGFNDGGRT